MSNYPAWWNATITVYNKYEDPVTRLITWHRVVLYNCFWKYTGNRIVVGDTALETNTTMCRIPTNPMYLEKYQWDDLADKYDYFTLSPGDIIVKGVVDDLIDEYEPGQRSTDLIAKYKKLSGCMVIEQCAVNAGPSRGLEHYYVRGV